MEIRTFINARILFNILILSRFLGHCIVIIEDKTKMESLLAENITQYILYFVKSDVFLMAKDEELQNLKDFSQNSKSYSEHLGEEFKGRLNANEILFRPDLVFSINVKYQSRVLFINKIQADTFYRCLKLSNKLNITSEMDQENLEWGNMMQYDMNKICEIYNLSANLSMCISSRRILLENIYQIMLFHENFTAFDFSKSLVVSYDLDPYYFFVVFLAKRQGLGISCSNGYLLFTHHHEPFAIYPHAILKNSALKIRCSQFIIRTDNSDEKYKELCCKEYDIYPLVMMILYFFNVNGKCLQIVINYDFHQKNNNAVMQKIYNFVKSSPKQNEYSIMFTITPNFPISIITILTDCPIIKSINAIKLGYYFDDSPNEALSTSKRPILELQNSRKCFNGFVKLGNLQRVEIEDFEDIRNRDICQMNLYLAGFIHKFNVKSLILKKSTIICRITESIRNFKFLRELELNNCTFAPEAISALLLPGFTLANSLKSLNITTNKHCKEFLKYIHNLIGLKTFILNARDFPAEFFAPKSLHKITHISDLTVHNFIPVILSEIKNLKLLNAIFKTKKLVDLLTQNGKDGKLINMIKTTPTSMTIDYQKEEIHISFDFQETSSKLNLFHIICGSEGYKEMPECILKLAKNYAIIKITIERIDISFCESFIKRFTNKTIEIFNLSAVPFDFVTKENPIFASAISYKFDFIRISKSKNFANIHPNVIFTNIYYE